MVLDFLGFFELVQINLFLISDVLKFLSSWVVCVAIMLASNPLNSDFSIDFSMCSFQGTCGMSVPSLVSSVLSDPF